MPRLLLFRFVVAFAVSATKICEAFAVPPLHSPMLDVSLPESDRLKPLHAKSDWISFVADQDGALLQRIMVLRKCTEPVLGKTIKHYEFLKLSLTNSFDREYGHFFISFSGVDDILCIKCQSASPLFAGFLSCEKVDDYFTKHLSHASYESNDGSMVETSCCRFKVFQNSDSIGSFHRLLGEAGYGIRYMDVLRATIIGVIGAKLIGVYLCDALDCRRDDAPISGRWTEVVLDFGEAGCLNFHSDNTAETDWERNPYFRTQVHSSLRSIMESYDPPLTRERIIKVL